MPVEIPEPWRSFLREVDRALSQPAEVHCLGGFVLMVLWQLPRPTGDVDFVEVAPAEALKELLALAGQDSELAKRYGLHFHNASMAECPEGYASRLIDLTPEGFSNLRLLALEVHDLVLAKLGRNSARDRYDVEFLSQKSLLNRRILEERYEAELRPYVQIESRHTDALRLWLDQYFPVQ